VIPGHDHGFVHRRGLVEALDAGVEHAFVLAGLEDEHADHGVIVIGGGSHRYHPDVLVVRGVGQLEVRGLHRTGAVYAEGHRPLVVAGVFAAIHAPVGRPFLDQIVGDHAVDPLGLVRQRVLLDDRGPLGDVDGDHVVQRATAHATESTLDVADRVIRLP